MIFWIISLFMAISTMAIVYVFANKFRDVPPDGTGHDRALYQARLTEIKQDLAIGRMDAQTSQAARIEEARKLIRLDDRPASTAAGMSSRLRSAISICAIVFVPLFSFGFYLGVTPPAYVNTAARENQAPNSTGQSIAALVQAVESRLEANPSDGAGWAVIAPVYLRLQRTTEAISAYRNALRLAGRQPALVAGLGEALVIDSGGDVTDEAVAMFQEVVILQPGHVSARFYLGLARNQAGDKPGAREIWQGLVAQASGDEPWLADISRRLATLNDANTLAAITAPDQERASDIREMSASKRLEMISGMVASLAERLEDDPNDRAGWERLIRSYLVLEKPEFARRSIAMARLHFAGDLPFLRKLDRIEASLEPRS